MKKILLIIGILSIIFLAGCGTFNLDGWIWPDDIEFMACIGELDTPEKIGGYMLENFTYKAHIFYAPSPYKLWLTKKGDCNDFATFGVFVANYHSYETYQIKIFYYGTSYNHRIAVYIEDEGMSFTDNGYYFNNWDNWFDTFREIVDFDCSELPDDLELKKYIVYDYENNFVEEGR